MPTIHTKNEIIKGKPAVWIVTHVEPQKDYTLILTFITGEKKKYDALPLLEKAIYAPLKNHAFFLKAKVVGDTVAWNDDIDNAPEHLYEYSSIC